MTIGICSVELYLPGITSLKQKRSIVNSIKTKTRKHFNVSISEVNYSEKWQRSILGIVGVSNNGKLLESSFKKILNNIHQKRGIEIIDYKIEVKNGIQTKKVEFSYNGDNF